MLFGVAFRGYVSCNLLGGSSNLGLSVWCLVLCCLVAVFFVVASVAWYRSVVVLLAVFLLDAMLYGVMLCIIVLVSICGMWAGYLVLCFWRARGSFAACECCWFVCDLDLAGWFDGCLLWYVIGGGIYVVWCF